MATSMYEVFSWTEQPGAAPNPPVRPVRRSVTPGSERSGSLHKRYSLAVAPHSTIDLDAGESGHLHKSTKNQAISAPSTPNSRHSAAVGAMSMSVCGERGLIDTFGDPCKGY